MNTIAIPTLEVRSAFLMQSEHYSTFSDTISALHSITPSSDPKLASWESIELGNDNGIQYFAFIYSPQAFGRTLNTKKMDDRLFVVQAIFDHMQSETQSPLKWEHVDEFGWLTAFQDLKWGVNVEEEFRKWEHQRANISTPYARKIP